MSALLPDVESVLIDLHKDEDLESFAHYQTVLESDQVSICLANAKKLSIYGSGSPEQIRCYVNNAQDDILIMRPPAERIPKILSYTGKQLEKLQLFKTNLNHLDLTNLTNLAELDVSQNEQLHSVFGLEKLTALTSLDLSKTKLSTIPLDIVSLEKLEYLSLSGLNLEDIPDWFPDYRLIQSDPESVDLSSIRIRKEAFQSYGLPREELCAKLRLKCGYSKPEYKVVLLGDAESGKTLTLKRLIHDDETPFEDQCNEVLDDKENYAPADFDHNSTPGVMIEEKDYDLEQYDLGDEQIRVHFWDFGGQDILHSAHSIFLTNNTLYVILLNTRNDTQDARARYWLRYLQAHKPDCPVLLVLNKIDQNPNASVDEHSLRKIHPKIQKILRLSSLKYNRKSFAESFTKVLLSELIHSDNLRFSFPSRYTYVRTWARQAGPYVELERFWDACRKCNDIYRAHTGIQITPDEEETAHRVLYQHFKTMYFGTHTNSNTYDEDGNHYEPYLILRPRWITNAIYTILINKHSMVTDGIIPKSDMVRLLAHKSIPGHVHMVVYPEETYTMATSKYVLDILKATGISFPTFNKNLTLNDKIDFIPMLCQRNTPAYVDEYINEPQVMQLRFSFRNLPNSILFRIMTSLLKDTPLLVKDSADCTNTSTGQKSEDSNVWLTGAKLQWSDSTCSAILLAEDHHIDIYMHPGDSAEAAKEKLQYIRDNVLTITEGMNVTCLIGLRINGQTEYYDYQLLEELQQQNIQVIYSKIKKELLYIDDVLSHRSDRPIPKLVDDIRQASEMLQNRKKYWESSEDERTDYLMDILRAKGYIVHGQERGGFSESGIQSGRLDLDIRRTSGNRWCALEALNLKSSCDTGLNYWKAHLKKLLDNYNEVGRTFLIHMSYVQCKKDKFNDLCNDLYECLSTYSPEGFKLMDSFTKEVPLTDEPIDSFTQEVFRTDEPSGFIRIFKCIYDCGKLQMTVYHFFSRVGE